MPSYQQNELINLVTLSQETISMLKRQIIHLQHRVALLEMDPSVVKNLTAKQLIQLREIMTVRMDSLNTVSTQKHSTSTYVLRR